MKKLLYTSSSICLLSLSLIGCGTLQNTETATANVVNTGVGYVAAATTTVGNTFVGGVRVLTGYPASNQAIATYHKRGVVYKNGHAYKIEHGRYVLVR